MRRVFLIFIFVFIAHICSAPNIDIQLGKLEMKLASDFVTRKYYESEFSRFVTDLGSRESGNNWLCINSLGCFGEWQFDESTLNYLGYKRVTLKKFKANPEIFPREMQLEALKTLIKINLIILMDYEHYIGDSIKDIKITKAGMIAASHLGGARSLMQFLDTNGRINKKDIFGTSIYDYLKKFSLYDLQ
jgi:hypothetical protein